MYLLVSQCISHQNLGPGPNLSIASRVVGVTQALFVFSLSPTQKKPPSKNLPVQIQEV